MNENTPNMEYILDPKNLQKSFTLSQESDEQAIVIEKNVIQNCGRHDIHVLDFLYRSYKNELNGVILNVEDDFHPQRQVSIFLGALAKSLKNQFVDAYLIICPDEAIPKWHYFLTTCGSLQVQLVTEEALKDLTLNDKTALLVSFSNITKIKSAELLLESCFESVVVDNLDQIASKMFMRKFQGNFNIGITLRNFYIEPDQKLQWTMLNWAHSGCVGKLADFYEIDNDNFNQFRDNYKEWWFRITWSFSESFVRPSLEEKGNLAIKLREWAKDHSLHNYCLVDNKNKTARKRLAQNNKACSNKDDIPKRICRTTAKKKTGSKITYKNNDKIKNELDDMKMCYDDSNSSDTLIYGDLSRKELSNETAQIMDKTEISDNVLSSTDGENRPLLRKEVSHADEMDVGNDTSNRLPKSLSCKSEVVSDLSSEFDQVRNSLLNNKTFYNSHSTNTQLELEINKIDVSTDDDNFWKEICSKKSETVESIYTTPNNHPDLKEESDVDRLIAEAMEIVSK